MAGEAFPLGLCVVIPMAKKVKKNNLNFPNLPSFRDLFSYATWTLRDGIGFYHIGICHSYNTWRLVIDVASQKITLTCQKDKGISENYYLSFIVVASP